MEEVKIDAKSNIPKYKQIIKSIELGIQNGVYKKGDKLPSINAIRKTYSLSRDTVLVAYDSLKIRGIVQSIAGKGYYVKNTDVKVSKKIFVLFDELNSFKEELYNSLMKNLGSSITIDPYFHHFNNNVFNKLICDSNGSYNNYIIMPANIEKSYEPIKKLPKNKVYILDQITPELSNYRAIYQNHEKDIFNRLIDATSLIKKYQNLILLFDEKQPLGMKKGVLKFCKIVNIQHEIVDTFTYAEPQKGDLYIVPDDKNLVIIIKKIKKERLRIGIDVGIIAINDTLLKEILEDGITTLTTNFNRMGRQLAKMILADEEMQIENPIELIKRKSL